MSQTLDLLKDNIRRVIADIRPQMLEKVIENWTARLDYITASRGSHMPKIIFKILAVNNIFPANGHHPMELLPVLSCPSSEDKSNIVEDLWRRNQFKDRRTWDYVGQFSQYRSPTKNIIMRKF
ncbi:hypothetical protein TNCV_1556641 [Trichonephila clavipes]|nr:hypothetical protein TNCV_1556641 [Trichonephila clavipes]